MEYFNPLINILSKIIYPNKAAEANNQNLESVSSVAHSSVAKVSDQFNPHQAKPSLNFKVSEDARSASLNFQELSSSVKEHSKTEDQSIEQIKLSKEFDFKNSDFQEVCNDLKGEHFSQNLKFEIVNKILEQRQFHSIENLTLLLDVLKQLTPNQNEQIVNKIIQTFLILSRENYLTFRGEDEKKYEHHLSALNALIDQIPLPNDHQLKDKLQFNEAQAEQKILLENISPEEEIKIREAYNHPLIDSITKTLAQSGNWSNAIELHSQNPQLSYILLAAYCQNKLSADDLAMGMSVHRAYYNGSKNVRVLDFNEGIKLLDSVTLSYDDALIEEQIKKHAANLPVSQRCFICIEESSIDYFTTSTLDTSFKDPSLKPDGFFKIEKNWKTFYIVASFGLAKALLKDINITLVPVVHLSEREAMIERTRKRLSDFALFLCDEKTIIHGSTDKIIFGYLHDLFHAKGRGRFKNMGIWNQLMDLALKIEKNNPDWIDCEKKLQYTQSNYPKFFIHPSEKDCISYLLNNVSGALVDSIIIINANGTLGKKHASVVVDEHVKKALQDLDPSVKSLLKNEIILQVKEKLKELLVSVLPD